MSAISPALVTLLAAALAGTGPELTPAVPGPDPAPLPIFTAPVLEDGSRVPLDVDQPTTSAAATWSRLPLWAGDVNQLAGTSDGTLFAATYTGVFRSTDAGEHWVSVNTGLPTATSVTIVAGPGDRLFLSVYSRGIFVSTNNGASWTASGGAGRVISCWSVTPAGVVLAGTGEGIVLRSQDAGANWTESALPVTSAVWTMTTPGSNVVLAGTLGRGVCRSSDGGRTWSQTSINSGFVRSLATLPNGEVVMGIESGPGTGGAFLHSADLGLTWTARTSPCGGAVVGLAERGGTMWAACQSGGVFASSDGGRTWSDSAPARPWSFGLRGIAIDREGRLFLATVGLGVYRSDDAGATWTEASSGMTGYSLQALVPDETGALVVATVPSGVFRSEDGGSSWKRVNQGLGTPLTSAIARSPRDRRLYAGTTSGRMYRSPDDGSDWQDISAGLPGSDAVNAIHVEDATGMIWVGKDFQGVWLRDPNGTTWKSLGCMPANFNVTALVEDAESNMVAGTLFAGLFRAAGGFSCWAPVNQGLPTDPGTIRSLASQPATGDLFATTFFGVYRLPAHESAWTRTSLSSPLVRSLAAAGDGALYAGIGLFNVARGNDVLRTSDAGASWTSIRGNLSTTEPITVVREANGRLFAGTWGGGLFASATAAPLSAPLAVAPAVRLGPCLPNPFRSTSEIRGHLPQPSRVVAQIFGIRGERVRTLVEADCPAGELVLRWDGRDELGRPQPSGLYLCRIAIDGTMESRKLVLAR